MPTESLGTNLVRLIEGAVALAFEHEQHRVVADALETGMALLLHAEPPAAHHDATHRLLLHANLLTALLEPAGAQLLAQVVDAVSRELEPSLDGEEQLQAVLKNLLDGCRCVTGIRCTAAAIADLGDDPLLALSTER